MQPPATTPPAGKAWDTAGQEDLLQDTFSGVEYPALPGDCCYIIISGSQRRLNLHIPGLAAGCGYLRTADLLPSTPNAAVMSERSSQSVRWPTRDVLQTTGLSDDSEAKVLLHMQRPTSAITTHAAQLDRRIRYPDTSGDPMNPQALSPQISGNNTSTTPPYWPGTISTLTGSCAQRW